MPSKLEQLQQQFRRHLLQEKEERMIKIHTESQQKALSKVARYSSSYSSLPTSNSKPPVSTSHHTPVKKGSPGVDRSRPLPPITKDSSPLSNIRSTPFNSPTYNTINKVSRANNSRSKSVDEVDSSPQQSPRTRVQPESENQQDDHQNGYTKVSESSQEFEISQHFVETTRVNKQIEVKTSRTSEPEPAQLTEPKTTDLKRTQPERKLDAESLSKLKQAELQRLRAKTREVSPSPRQNGFSSNTVTRSVSASTPLRKPAAKPTTTPPLRSRPSFQNATAASSRKTAPATSKPPGREAQSVASAAVSRNPPGPGQEQCRICGRNFNADRIEKHATICAKAAKKKVKVFDATKMRVKGTEAEQFVKKGVQKVKPKSKQSDWRKKHNEFIEAIRQAKVVQQHLAKGGKVSDLPPPPPSDTSDYVQCPHCNRKFNEGVAERHIPKCKNILSNKKNPVPRRK